VLGTFFKAIRSRHSRTPVGSPDEHTIPACQCLDRIVLLAERLATVERNEALRAAEHATAVDQLSRLYKRLSAREWRAANGAKAEESPLDLRRRLGK